MGHVAISHTAAAMRHSLRHLVAALALAPATLAAQQPAAPQPAAAPPPAGPPPGPPATPCADRADARRFDFCEGDWEVRTAAGQPAGRSSVKRVAGGCGLQEWWTAGNGSTGTSLNAYNPVTGQWQQYWVGQGGAITEYRRSEWRPDGSLALVGDGRRSDGTPMLLRMTFTPLPTGVVRQFMESSADGGTTWTTTGDLHYHRVRR